MTSKPPFGGEVIGDIAVGNLGKTQSGGTPSSKHSEYFGGDIPWIGTTALNGGVLDESNAVKFITEDAVEHSATKIVPAGSIMVGVRVGVGKVAVNSVPMCTSQDIVSIIGVDEQLWNKEYISYAIQYKAPLLAAQAQGATITGITSKALKAITIPVREKSRQDQIVWTLNYLKELLLLSEQRLAKLDELVKSRFVEMFGGSSLATRTIGELATDIRYGTSKKSSDEGRYTYLRMNNMTDDGRLDFADTRRITLDGSELDKCLVHKGDLLFNRTNSREKVGKTAVFEEDEPMVIAGYIIRVRLVPDIRSRYLCAYMNLPHVKEQLRAMAKGAVHQANINAKQLGSIQVPVPRISQQDEFISFVSRVDKLRVEAQVQKEKLQMLYDSLVQDYFAI